MTTTTIESFLHAAWRESFTAQKGSDLQFTNRVDEMIGELAKHMVYLAFSIESRPRLMEAYADAIREIFADKPHWFYVRVGARAATKLEQILPADIWEIVRSHLS